MHTTKVSLYSRVILSLLLPFVFSIAFAQQTVPIGGWKMHLPYQECHYVTGSSYAVWCATDKGLFRLNKSDYSVERINKINGLSDLSIGTLGYNAYNDILLVGYKNGNVDLVHGTTIVNIPDIKRAQIIGDKAIHNVYFIGKLAYLSTGFGIVVIDTERNEVKDTYMIGNNGTNLEVYDITSDGTTFYVGTENGIYYAPINDPYLTNFATWSRFANGALPTGIPNGHYNTLAYYNGELVANWAITYPNRSLTGDTVYYYDFASSTWNHVTGWSGGNRTTMDITTANGALIMCDFFQIEVKAGSASAPGNPYFFLNPSGTYLRPEQVYVDPNANIWEADLRFGLVNMIDPTHGNSYYPNGPLSTSAYAMVEQDQNVLVVPGGHDDAWNNVFDIDGVSYYKDNNWTDFTRDATPGFDTLYDFVACAVDPQNKDHIWLGSWGKGLVEMNNGAVVDDWDNLHPNCTLQRKVEYQWCGVAGLQYDDNNNLWMTNSHALTCLDVYKADGTWQAFDFAGLIPVGETVSQLMITSTGQKWMILPRGQGMLVFDDNGTLSNTSDDKKNKLGFTSGTGSIPGTDIYCMAEDQDGEVWIGTDKGIAVFYCAADATTPGGCEAQQILIEQDGYVQILMETQIVTCIVVDGANRKWIGTEGGGVFLMSADGTKQLAHFTSENSPLLSDDITSMTMNKSTGELFIGTSNGIVSYRGEATEGDDVMGDVYAFPNPVQHDYTGPIAITGLVRNANVKITDVRGQLVYETTALGGQAIWPGTNFKGERAATGVYLVFISNEDGSQKAVTKILLIN